MKGHQILNAALREMVREDYGEEFLERLIPFQGSDEEVHYWLTQIASGDFVLSVRLLDGKLHPCLRESY